ncbi:MAG: M48 family metallopeptidase [Clostridia bacterium]|nr:M48 family metallopeptidase [Clostridia bacterium]
MKITYSKRKTLSLSINAAGEPEVRVPLGCPSWVIEGFIQKHRRWIEKRLAEQKQKKQYTPAEIEQLRQRAKELLPQRVAYYAPLMGVSPASVRITSAKTRYGSCSGKNAICFSLYLMEKSPRAVDYVVVHELAHIKQHNHSPAFYKEIEKILPDYRERIKELKAT